MLFVKGVGTLVLALCAFSVFSIKFPKGVLAMSGLANAAITTFLVEAICKYILGNLAGLEYFTSVGASAGALGGVAAAIMVGLAMGTNPICAVASAMALSGFSILPGFISGYAVNFIVMPIMKKLPNGINTIFGALLSATISYGICHMVEPGVTIVIAFIGDAILAATNHSPIVMGFLLGGIMKIVCTSPLSSMALTAMLGLTGMPMGIACIACFGGAFSNGVIFWRLKLTDKSKVLAVILEPLTQVDVVTQNSVAFYTSSFIGGGLCGICAGALGIICNAPGTASTIPGMLAPFAFNPPVKVVLALTLALLLGVVSGLITAGIFNGQLKNR